MNNPKQLLADLKKGDQRALARCITLVENEAEGYKDILLGLVPANVPVIGITGPPGAGKSTLIDVLIGELLSQGKKVGVIAVDPTSPFNYGSLLGDRLRMGRHFTNENVFIRSLATRGSLGGLSAKAIEITDLMKCAGFDYIIIETVGVGQSEVEIAGLADTTVLVLVPEAGDEVQTIKSGIMEIADIYIVNKADRDGAELFARNLNQLVHSHPASQWTPRVIKTVASEGKGVSELMEALYEHGTKDGNAKRNFLLTEKALRLIQNARMRGINRQTLQGEIEKASKEKGFNLYAFVENKVKSYS